MTYFELSVSLLRRRSWRYHSVAMALWYWQSNVVCSPVFTSFSVENVLTSSSATPSPDTHNAMTSLTPCLCMRALQVDSDRRWKAAKEPCYQEINFISDTLNYIVYLATSATRLWQLKLYKIIGAYYRSGNLMIDDISRWRYRQWYGRRSSYASGRD